MPLDEPGWVKMPLDSLDEPGWVKMPLDSLDEPGWVWNTSNPTI